MGFQKPGLMDDQNSLDPVDSVKNPVCLVGVRAGLTLCDHCI